MEHFLVLPTKFIKTNVSSILVQLLLLASYCPTSDEIGNRDEKGRLKSYSLYSNRSTLVLKQNEQLWGESGRVGTATGNTASIIWRISITVESALQTH